MENHALYKCLCHGHKPYIVIRDTNCIKNDFCKKHDYEAKVVEWKSNSLELIVMDSDPSDITTGLYTIVQYQHVISFDCTFCTPH